MKIKYFNLYMKENELEQAWLRDATLVVEGSEFFARSYDRSGLTLALGCDSHRYADYVRQLLAMFKKAKIKCYFLFNGIDDTIQKRLENQENTSGIVPPLFMRDVYKEILDEMGFDYVTCEHDSKTDVIALGKQFDCPIVNNDVEFCFSQCKYIPSDELQYNEEHNAIEFRYFHLKSFLEKHNLTEEKVAIFIVLLDMQFPSGHFDRLFRYLKVPSGPRCVRVLLRWLAQQTHQQSLKTISQFLTKDDYNNFYALRTKMLLLMQRKESGGAAAAALTTRREEAARHGNWFAAGVAAGHVAIDYVSLYRSNQFFGSDIIKSKQCEDNAMYLSMSIVRYAFDLLTNFRYDAFEFVCHTESGCKTIRVGDDLSIEPPPYEANFNVFEDGWDEVRHDHLFAHFIEQVVCIDQRHLSYAPRDARLLLLALAYFARRRAAAAPAVAAAVLAGYVTLAHVYKKMDPDYQKLDTFRSQPYERATTDKDDLKVEDCNIAAQIMEKYAKTSDVEVSDIYDVGLAYPLVEFQHCLSQMNNLNALCGGELARAELRLAYAGPLVYKLRRAALRHRLPLRQFFDQLLKPAPTVLGFLNGLLNLYEMIIEKAYWNDQQDSSDATSD